MHETQKSPLIRCPNVKLDYLIFKTNICLLLKRESLSLYLSLSLSLSGTFLIYVVEKSGIITIRFNPTVELVM